MPRVQQTTVTGVAASAPLVVDRNSVGPDAAVFIKIGAGCTASVQVTPDNVLDASVTPVWYAAPAASLAGAVANVGAALGIAVCAVRLNQTVGANTSTLLLVDKGIV